MKDAMMKRRIASYLFAAALAACGIGVGRRATAGCGRGIMRKLEWLPACQDIRRQAGRRSGYALFR